MVIAVARYVLARCFISQRWVPPLALYALASAVIYSGNGDAAGSGGASGLLLLVVSAWMTIAALHADDPSQIAIIATSVGSPVRARLVVIGVGAAVCLVLGALSIGTAVATDPKHAQVLGLGETLMALAALQCMAIASGAALGQLCARPLVRRAGFSWILAVLGIVAIVAIPGAPLTQVLTVLSNTDTSRFGIRILPPLITQLMLAGAALAAGTWFYRRRSP